MNSIYTSIYFKESRSYEISECLLGRMYVSIFITLLTLPIIIKRFGLLLLFDEDQTLF